MPSYYPPHKIQEHRGLDRPLTRPFNCDPYCHLALLPEVNTTWRDYSGKGNDGTIVGATPAVTPRGGGLYFDGVSDYVTHGNILLMGTSDFTLMLWVCLTDITTQNGALISKGHVDIAAAPSRQGYRLMWDKFATNIEARIQDNATRVNTTSASALVANVWYHIAVTFDRSATCQIYIDGVADGAAVDISAVGDVDFNKNLVVGAYSNNPATKETTGYIDEVLVFKRVLTPEEIFNIYMAGRP